MNKLLFSCLALISAPLFAQQSVPGQKTEGTFCRTPVMSLDASPVASIITDKTVFSCDNGIKGSLPDLVSKGWKVSTLIPNVAYDPKLSSSFTLTFITR